MKFLRAAYLQAIGYSGTMREFRTTVADAFAYLADEFGFGPLRYESTSYGGFVTSDNGTSVFEIHLDWREERVLPYLRPVPAHGASRRIGSPGVLLDTLILQRDGKPVSQKDVLDRSHLHRVLEQYGTALREYGSEVMRGEFSALEAAVAAFPQPLPHVLPH